MVALFATSNVKLPSISVTVPFVVPTSRIFAPMMDNPSESATVPVICLRCCCTFALATEQNRFTDNMSNVIFVTNKKCLKSLFLSYTHKNFRWLIIKLFNSKDLKMFIAYIILNKQLPFSYDGANINLFFM